jgi:succinate dehydrogenase flavin-adding protein (antitoxin of CptAB toxin-antitoxin module)
MKELDLLLERFAREHYAAASAEQRRAFERLLELPDPLLLSYLLGDARAVDAPLAQVVDLVRDAELRRAP